MAALAVCLPFPLAVALGMAERADRLNVPVMFARVAKMMVVLVPPLSVVPDVTAIGARQQVGMRTASCANLDVDSLPCLLTIAVAGRYWRGAWASGSAVLTGHGAGL